MEIATLIFILSFLAIVATLVVSATRYMCEQKSKVSRNSYSLTKEKAERISKNTEMSYLTKYGQNCNSESTEILADREISNPIVGKLSYELDTSWYQKEVNETQEKWKLTIPKHSTRIKNRNKRKGRSKGVRSKKK